MRFAEVDVPMTNFEIDVLIGGTKKEYSLFQQKRYGLAKEVTDDCYDSETCTMQSSDESELKGEIRFTLKLEKSPKENIPVFIHELWHLMWQISNTIKDLKLNNETQQWSACMIEEISKSVLNAKYVKL